MPAITSLTFLSHNKFKLAAIVACLALATAQAQEELPSDRLLRTLQPTADVNDFAAILTPAQRDALEQRCKAVREKTGAQLAVVTLKSLEGGQIDDFAVKLFQRWGVGQKDKKNGVLLLVAIQDRKARIEVGYGLEPILPDALAGRILDEQLFPAFRQKRYADGLTAAVNRIAEIVERNEPAPKNVRGRAAKPASVNTAVIFLIVSLLLTCFGSYFVGGGLGAKKTNVGLFGSLFLGGALIMGCVAAFPWSPIIDLPLAVILALLGWRTGRKNPAAFDVQFDNTGTWGGTGGYYSGGGWSSGGWSGGSSFSGGSDSWGGFGGGSSGGGGASGGW